MSVKYIQFVFCNYGLHLRAILVYWATPRTHILNKYDLQLFVLRNCILTCSKMKAITQPASIKLSCLCLLLLFLGPFVQFKSQPDC